MRLNLPCPGETLRDGVLPGLGLTVTDAAQALGVTRTALSRVLNGKVEISSQIEPQENRRIKKYSK